MIGHRASTDPMVREMFRGWDTVQVNRDITGGLIVTLSISEKSFHAMANPFEGPGAVIDRLMPKRVRKPRFSGVRFHGRIVGRRA